MLFNSFSFKSQLVLTSNVNEDTEQRKFKCYPVFEDVRKKLETVSFTLPFAKYDSINQLFLKNVPNRYAHRYSEKRSSALSL